MNQNNPATGANPASYVRYDYTSPRYQLRRYAPIAARSQPETKPSSPYEFSASTISNPVDQGPHTVEQLVTQGYFAISTSMPETALLEDRKHTSWLSLEDAISQVRQRLDIYSQNMYELKLAQCAAQNDLFAFESKYGWPAPTEQQYVMGKRLQRLYSEQREERVSLWKDVSMLKQELPEALRQYLSATRKLQILDANGGDSP